jgi:hypothetical protein
VTSATDGAPGSLRATIASAQAGDVIRFAPQLRGARLPISLGELVINKSLTINGSSQTLDAGGNSRVLEVDGSSTSVILSRLTITGGVADLFSIPTRAFAGGGILVENANVMLRNCLIVGNRAHGQPGGDTGAAIPAQGGGIFAFHAQVSLMNSSVVANQSVGGVDSSTDQAGAAGGGGLSLTETQLQIVGGKIAGNLAQGGDAVNRIDKFPSSDGGAGDGGGLLLLGSSARLTRVNIIANRAAGGLGLDGTLAPPKAGFGTPGPGIGGTAAGGAIFAEGAPEGSSTGTVSLNNVNINSNVAQGGAAGKAKDGSQPAVPGGMAVGGAIEQLERTTLVLQRTNFQANQALGGIAAQNIVDGGADTSSGGEAFGGAIDSEFFDAINASNVKFNNNLAQGTRGGDSAPGSGTEAGTGGPAQGGAWNLRDTGGTHPSPPLPVSLNNVTFQNNQALAGGPGTGTVPPGTGAGGYATGGGMQTNGIFQLRMNNTRWLNNRVVAQQGEFGFGGALGISFGFTTSQTMISRSVFSGNSVKGGDDPQDVTLRTAAGGAILNNAPNTTIVASSFQNNVVLGGNATGIGVPGNATGGAIDSSGGDTVSLTLSADKLIGNRAVAGSTLAGPDSSSVDSGQAGGGAVAIDGGQFNNLGVRYSANLALTGSVGTTHGAFGGAVYVLPDASANLTGDAFQGNQASGLGGNSAFGGAVANLSKAFSLNASSFTTNEATVQGTGTAFGGGLYLANNSSLSQSKITRNAALARGAGQGFGGGIAFANNPKVSLQQVTVTGNRATTSGPDFFGNHQSG